MNLGSIGTLIIELKAEGVGKAEAGIQKVEGAFSKTAKSVSSKAPQLEHFMKRWGTSLALVGIAAGALVGLIKMGPMASSYFMEFGTVLGEISDILISSLSPAIDPVVDALWWFVDALDAADPIIKQILGVLAIVSATIVGVSAVVGVLGGGFGTVITFILGVLGTLVAALGWPVIVAILAIIAAVWLLWSNWDTVVALISGAWDWLVGAAKWAADGLSGAWEWLASSISSIWTGIKDSIGNAMKGAWETVKIYGGKIWDLLINVPILGPILKAAIDAGKFLMGSFQTGTDYVPRTGPYLLHQGEKVIPAGENGGTGGQTFNMSFNITGGGTQEIANEVIRIIQNESRRLA